MASQAEMQAFLAALTAQTQAATAAMTAAAAAMPVAPVAPVVPVPPVPPAFSLLPGSAALQPLTFTTAEDMKIYNAATKGLETKFDMKEDNLHLFLTEVKERVRTFGWTDIIMVPDSAAVARNMLTNFGQVTVQNCIDHATTYYQTQTRNAQNSMFLYQFLHESLTADAKAIMVSSLATYSLTDVPIGIIYLKILIGKSSIDTKAKVLLMREQVSNLHMKMLDLKGNVREFNTYVDQLRTALEGRGQVVAELTAHVFKAYLTVPDPTFQRYIESTQNRYEEEGADDIPIDTLMMLACNKYDLITHRNAMPGDNSDRIVALEAQLQTLQPTKNTDDSGKDGRNSRRRPKHPEWKLIAPGTGDAQTKKVGPKTFHWCPYHKLWSIHTAQECRKGSNPAPTPHQPAAATTAPIKDATNAQLQPDPKYTAIFRAAKAVFDAESDGSN
jgi:hypothetical protein